MTSKSKSIFDMIKDQPKVAVDKVYGKDATNSQAPFACKAIFQSLSMLAKSYVMRLIFIDHFILESLSEWTKIEYRKEHNSAIEELLRLRIIVETNENELQSDKKEQIIIDVDNIVKHTVNPYFLINFRIALTNPCEPWSTEIKTESPTTQTSSETIPTKDELELFTLTRWNEVLGFIVDILPPNHQLLQFNVLEAFVLNTGIMKRVTPNGNKLIITSIGYEYMLKEYSQQVWEFVLQGLRQSKSQADALSLLFLLSYCEYGHGYPISALTTSQQQLIFEFSQLGLVYMIDPKTSTLFYPTRVAINMIFGKIIHQHTISENNRSSQAQQTQRMTLIVETNNQVVAYVYTDLHLAMLKLFVDVNVRMPNMAIGRITREKSKQAFQKGIKAAQIIDFLQMHAHYTVKDKVPIIPENVTDQLTLWEAENIRILAQMAVVVDFREIPGTTPQIFDTLTASLSRVKVLVWCNRDILSFAVTEEGEKLVHSYFKQKLGFH